MDDELRLLTSNLSFNDGASGVEIERLQEATGGKLPQDYFDFVREMNGAYGDVGGKRWLIMVPVEEVLDHNRALETDSFAPGLIVFADDGGLEAYAFDTLEAGTPIVNVPYIGMRREEIFEIGRTFREFLQWLATGGGFALDS
jgi:hypothetical protein